MFQYSDFEYTFIVVFNVQVYLTNIHNTTSCASTLKMFSVSFEMMHKAFKNPCKWKGLELMSILL